MAAPSPREQPGRLSRSLSLRSASPPRAGEIGDARLSRRSSVGSADVPYAEPRPEEEEEGQEPEPVACIDRGPVSTFFASMVLVNSVFIGLDTQARAAEASPAVLSLLAAVEIGFFALFLAELVMRICADRCPGFLWEPWNLLDAFIVGSGAVDLVFTHVIGQGSSADDVGKLRAIRLLKITRIVRLFRIFRVFRFKRLLRNIRGLLLLLKAIVGALRALGWVILMFSVSTYLFAIVTTEFIGLANEDDDGLLNEWFGDMFSSMFTLMQLSTLEEWAAIARHVGKRQGLHWLVILMAYVLGTNLILMNVALATLIQNVISLNTEMKSAQAGEGGDEVESWMKTPSSLASEDEEEEQEEARDSKQPRTSGAMLAAGMPGVMQQSAADRLTTQTLSELFEQASAFVGIEGVNQRRLVTSSSFADALTKLDVQEKLFQVCPALKGLETPEVLKMVFGACPKRLDREGMLRQELAEAVLALRGELSMNHFVIIGQTLQTLERHIDHELVHLNKHQRKINRRFLKLRHRLRKVYHFDGAPRKMVELVNEMKRKNIEAAAAKVARGISTPSAKSANVREDSEHDGSEIALSEPSSPSEEPENW